MQKLVFLFLFFVTISAKCQQSNTLHVRFFDEKVGSKAPITSIEISNDKFKSVSIENKGVLDFSVPDGTFNIKVLSEDFATMLTNVTVSNNSETSIDFQMERKIPLAQTSFDYLFSNQSPERMLVTGFVTNSENGTIVKNAKVFNTKYKLHTTTDDNGFFKLTIPLSLNANDLAIHVLAKGYNEEIRKNYDAFPYGDVCLKIALTKGNTVHEENVVLEREPALMLYDPNIKYDRNYFQPLITWNKLTQIPDCATTIKVGKTCSCHTCTNGFDVLNFNTYTANVVTSEWGQWGAWTNGIQSLNAGAVAIRSYALNRIVFPIASHGSYDICNTTCCHVYNPSTTATTYATAAIANTDNYILLTASNNIAQAEFAAETNDNCAPIQTSGNYCGQCGDGKFQKSVNGPPINSGGCYPASGTDPVCTGQTNSGHPRGMCQRGSVRWATGFTVPNNTTIGTAHSFGTKTWQQMMAYYYPYYTLSQCNVVAPPALPGAFTLSVDALCNGTASQNKLQWTNSLNATNYDVYRNGVLFSAGITGTQFLNTSIVAGTTYTYNVVANNAVGSTNNANGIVSATASLCNAAAIDSANVYLTPNPTTGVFNVNIINSTNKNYSILLLSNIGKKIYSTKSIATSNNHQQTINITNHAAGLYFIKIEVAGIITTKKILKR